MLANSRHASELLETEQQGHSERHGKLAQEWGLRGEVGAEHFARLTEGLHPQTEEQMVRHQPAKTYENQLGGEVTSVEHRAGWDATFSAPKSVTLTALVGMRHVLYSESGRVSAQSVAERDTAAPK